MKFRKSYHFLPLCLILCSVVGIGILFHFAIASSADDQESAMLGTLSQRYEAGSPGTISSGDGDLGGKSYGSYQFASRWDTPKEFFNWCREHDNTYYRSIGQRLYDAYYKGDDGYDSDFDQEWEALAEENREGFQEAQRNYIRLAYYDPIVTAAELDIPGFEMSNYSIALRNVFWSRAVQHGAGDALELIEDAFRSLGGFHNQAESELIDAIYAQSGKTRPVESGDKYYMSGTEAAKYGVDDQVLTCFRGSRGDVQLGVYLRLRINEPASAQLMLAQHGYDDAVLSEGIYQLSPTDNSQLSLRGDGSSIALQKQGSSESQSLRLTFLASGYYTIENESTGKRLSEADTGEIVLATPSTSRRQMWKLEKSNGVFTLRNRATGSYLSAGSAAAGSVPVPSDSPSQWQLLRGSGQWSLESAVYPTYGNNLRAGSSAFSFRGVLRSSYPIESVQVSVLTDSSRNAFPPATASGVGERSYDLSRMDSDMAFSRLGPGHYTMVITATSTAEKGADFTMESPFYVSGQGYKVTFDPQGGTCAERSRSIEEGQVYGELPTPRKDGYVFTGWYTAKEGGEKVTATSRKGACSTTLYARYARAYTYRFVDYNGEEISSGTLRQGSTIPAPDKAPQRSDSDTHSYQFTGWKGWHEGMTISENVTFKAQYKSIALEKPEVEKPKPAEPEKPAPEQSKPEKPKPEKPEKPAPEQTKPANKPEKPAKAAAITSDTYRIERSYLRRIPLGTSLDTLKSHLHPGEEIVLRQGRSQGGDVAATGMEAVLRRDGEDLHILTLVVTGDVNGDGKVTLTDMLQLQANLLGQKELSWAGWRAADVSGDGKVTLTDLVQLTSVLLDKSQIQPY